MAFSRTELLGAGLARADPSLGDGPNPKGFEPPKLDIESSIRMVEITDTGSIRTFYSTIPNLTHGQSSSPRIAARIFVVAGCENPQDRLAPWIRLNPSLWPRFLQAHFDGDEGLQRLLHRENTGIFFFNWGRLVSQDKEQYEIGKRILARKPYDIGAIGDPLLRNLDHKRYYQWPDRPYRKYSMISSSSDGTVFYHAAKECVSFYSEDTGGVFTGILLVDPIRHHRIFDITFNFWYGGVDFDEHRTQCFLNSSGQETSPNSSSYQTDRERTLLNEQPSVSYRFISTLQRYIKNPTPDNSYSLVYITLMQLVCDDITQLLEKMNSTFSTIELALHDNHILQESLPLWRAQLGCCLNISFEQSELLHHLSEGLGMLTTAPTTTSSNAYNQPLTPASNSIFKDEQDAASARLLTLSSAVDRVNRRGGGAFQALMSSMSIVGSQRAIAEAELVLKLTQLAFFFTPLGLIAAVFGMNVNEFEGKLTWSLWLAISLATSATTYALLYRVEILAGLGRVPHLVRNISIRRLSKLAVRWLGVLQSILSRMPILLILLAILSILAGFAVTTWKLAAIENISVSTKVSLAVVGLWVPAIVLLVTIYFT
ncbi:hypothetical protein TWF225_010633 [Orbilia oligospora]|uniref:Uncharacterized protein n=1 Tax=Orbilia oligospora TaxID=2813651 RepID=A0A8H2DQS4_ORBOL|nr:hypothetical protein TWF225_010633 [Orbilia oligospora]KAF3237324.1 hypothetical protein TWF128_000938 [Orbilia oligospora]KAF3237325.1 hypothetical protein TWF128_000938 [Orbilia oligospora]KAF3243797.1 hypothetical protein TWF217_011137 [Orbilia oligospora]KAF3275801.1 hypothetical protein TWF132_002611 [Orbilia oligospora]